MNLKHKPIIGVTAKFLSRADIDLESKQKLKNEKRHYISSNYINAITEAGGTPIIIPMYDNPELANQIIPLIDGIVFSGGCDIDPKYFGEDPHDKLGEVVPELDAMELSLFKKIVEDTNIPILGICRGLQVGNVACGGSLFQDISLTQATLKHSLGEDANQYEIAHKVLIDRDSRLYNIVGKDEIGVNSFHHQMAKKIASGLKMVAVSEDGIIEALEPENPSDDRFILLVQWHPEMLAPSDSISDETSKKILKAFVEASGR